MKKLTQNQYVIRGVTLIRLDFKRLYYISANRMSTFLQSFMPFYGVEDAMTLLLFIF